MYIHVNRLKAIAKEFGGLESVPKRKKGANSDDSRDLANNLKGDYINTVVNVMIKDPFFAEDISEVAKYLQSKKEAKSYKGFGGLGNKK
jgi:hypothetical protein